MAILVPDNVEEFSTEGERLFHGFLSRVAIPDSRFLVWYEPSVYDDSGDSLPDFLLFNPDVGLIVFEVKDWGLDQVREADPKKFTLEFGGKISVKTNPYAQAREYYYRLRTLIQNDGRLISREVGSFGTCRVPISYGVVFTNIARHEYEARFGNDAIIPIRNIFFYEDLSPDSEYHDGAGVRFLESLKNRFPPRFLYRYDSRDLNVLRQILFPIVRVPEVKRGPSPDHREHEERIFLLDRLQESIARRYSRGRHVVVGPPGSGKTLVLVHQAAFLRKHLPAVKRILFLCFNSSLVNHVRSLLSTIGVPLGEQGVEVLPIFELCEKILGQPISLEKEETAYYDMVIDEVLSKDPGEQYRYDAVLVDEGQDFDTRMLQVALKCLNPATDVFTVALDEGQEIYGRTRDWRALGINLKGKVRSLGSSYRNTFEIAAFADRFRTDTGKPSPRLPAEPSASIASTPRVEQFQLFPDPPVIHGPEPELLSFPSMEEAISWTAKKIRALRDERAYSLAEIAVIYTRRRLDPDHPEPFPVRMMKALEREGVVSRWIAEDYRSRRACDITADSVAINTIHSAKGLDFGCVFLYGLDTIDMGEDQESDQRARNLICSGITRARYQLFVPYLKEEGIFGKMKF